MLALIQKFVMAFRRPQVTVVHEQDILLINGRIYKVMPNHLLKLRIHNYEHPTDGGK